MGPELASVLQTPPVDVPVAALLSTSSLLGQPEDRRAEQALQRAHQGAAWAIFSSSTASSFNRATLLWLRQLQDKLSSEDTRIHLRLSQYYNFQLMRLCVPPVLPPRPWCLLWRLATCFGYEVGRRMPTTSGVWLPPLSLGEACLGRL